jgi:hypothetical protein
MRERNYLRPLVWGWLLVALACFLVRGSGRLLPGTVEAGGDLAAPYAGARAWVRGQNPYDEVVLMEVLREAGREKGERGNPALTTPMYPPTTFPLLAPFAAVPWSQAKLLWHGLGLALFGWQLGLLCTFLPPQERTTRAVALVAFLLSLAPYQTGFALGQVSTVATALVVIGASLACKQRDGLAGAALGCAMLLKPTLSFSCLLGLLALRRVRALGWAGVTIGLVAAVALAWLWANAVDWVPTLAADLRHTEVGVEINPTGPLKVQMIDWRPLFAAAFGQGKAAELARYALVVLTGGYGLVLAVLLRRRGEDFLVLAALAVWGLLVTYHRFYDAALLSLPVTWAFRELGGPHRGWARTVLLLAVPFFLPGAVLLAQGVCPGSPLTDSLAWKVGVEMHQPLCLSAVLLCLFGVMWDVYRRGRRPAQAVSEPGSSRLLVSLDP